MSYKKRFFSIANNNHVDNT